MGNNGNAKDNVPELKEYFSHLKIPDALSGFSESKYVIFGVPFDGTSSYRRGSRLAPKSIREAYDNLESYDVAYEVDFSESGMCDMGDLSVSEDVGEVVDEVEYVTGRIMGLNKIPIMLGGEHSVTVGAVRNLKDASMLIIDAHSDFRDSYMGDKLNHACVTRRALDILGPDRIVSVGTRSTSREEFESDRKNDVWFLSSAEVREKGIQSMADKIEEYLTDNVYFSIDMDGIDPAYAPGVGTPEPYGLKDSDVQYLIRRLGKKVVGFDVVEMTPVYDNGNTSMLAAKLIQDFVGSKETRNKF